MAKFNIIMAVFLCISVLAVTGCGIKPKDLEAPQQAETGQKPDFPRKYPTY